MLNQKKLMKDCTKKEIKRMLYEHFAIRDYLQDRLKEVDQVIVAIENTITKWKK